MACGENESVALFAGLPKSRISRASGLVVGSIDSNVVRFEEAEKVNDGRKGGSASPACSLHVDDEYTDDADGGVEVEVGEALARR